MMAQSGLQRSIGHGVNMNIEYTVRINGRPVKKFQDKHDAQQFMIWYSQDLQAQEMRYKFIEEAVSKSDFKQAQELIQSIMEKK
jgi:thioredoxin-like negative regulator of GroEL